MANRLSSAGFDEVNWYICERPTWQGTEGCSSQHSPKCWGPQSKNLQGIEFHKQWQELEIDSFQVEPSQGPGPCMGDTLNEALWDIIKKDPFKLCSDSWEP